MSAIPISADVPLPRLIWPVLAWTGLFALAGFLFFYRLADRDLWSSHEARAAQNAQTIVEEGTWGLPRLFDRNIDMQKPPMYYWLVAVTAIVRGQSVDAWTVRFPSALAALLGLVFLAALAWLQGRKMAAYLAAGVLMTAMHYTWLSRLGRIDMPLTVAILACLAGYYLAWTRRGGWHWLLFAYLAAAMAILLKGPIGVVLPLAVIGVHQAVERDGSWRNLGVWWGVPLVLALSLSWFFWANAATQGEFFHVFFGKHNLERGFGGGSLASHPWWFYIPRLAFDALPWSLLLPAAVVLMMRRGWWQADPEARFGLIWLGSMVLVLSLAQFKRADYLLPAYPGMALLLGTVAERVLAEANRRTLVVGAYGGILLCFGVGWGTYVTYWLPHEDARLDARPFASAVRRLAPVPQLVLFFRVESHALAFHVGRPIDTLLEWENLDVWAARPEGYYVIMPPEEAAQWQEHLTAGVLEEVCRNTDFSDQPQARPLVLLRMTPLSLSP